MAAGERYALLYPGVRRVETADVCDAALSSDPTKSCKQRSNWRFGEGYSEMVLCWQHLLRNVLQPWSNPKMEKIMRENP